MQTTSVTEWANKLNRVNLVIFSDATNEVEWLGQEF
jgi:hypothetical protein